MADNTSHIQDIINMIKRKLYNIHDDIINYKALRKEDEGNELFVKKLVLSSEK